MGRSTRERRKYEKGIQYSVCYCNAACCGAVFGVFGVVNGSAQGQMGEHMPAYDFDIYGEMTVVNKTEREEIRMPIDDGKIWNSNGTVTRLQISLYDGNFSIRIPDESKESFTEYDVLYRGTYHMEKKELILDMPDGGRIVMQQMTVAE